MSEENLQKVQAFLDQLDQDPEAKARFQALAENNDVSGFEAWAEEAGCDVGLLGQLMPSTEAPEGELSDDALEAVAGGAGSRWFARSSTTSRLTNTPQLEIVSAKINSAWARWQKMTYQNRPR